DNLSPWCLRMPADANQRALVEAQRQDPANFVQGDSGPVPMPICDPIIRPRDQNDLSVDPKAMTAAQKDDGGSPGAMNPAMAVFVYLDQVVAHGLVPKPQYDQCEFYNPQ